MKKRWVFSLLMITAWVFGDPPPDSTSVPPGRLYHGYTHLFLTGDFIYWKARQEELNQIGTLMISQTGTVFNNSISSQDIHFEYSPGFKLGLGGNLPYDDWDVYVNWTHLRNNPKTSFCSSSHDLVNIERLGGPVSLFLSNRAKVEFDV
ncbi:MAG: hypothetical protein KDK64_01670 [Chlamydiia bacterium]|nr:hypothetical protein [Chlamydiia bacterium]